MCTALFSLAQNKNEKEALAVPELTSRFRDFFINLVRAPGKIRKGTRTTPGFLGETEDK